MPDGSPRCKNFMVPSSARASRFPCKIKRPMARPHGQVLFASALLRKSLEELASRIGRTRKSPSAAQVHDLRVSIRRFTQALRVFKPCFPAKEVKRVQRALKKVMDLAGNVRDLDIAQEVLEKSRIADAVGLRSEFGRRRKQAGRALCDKLQRWSKRRTSSKWQRQLKPAAAGAAALGTVWGRANEILPVLAKRLLALSRRSARGKGDRLEQLHQLRIAAKKMRYTLELFVFLQPSVIRERLAQLKKLQSTLGTINDLEIVHDMLVKEHASKRLCAELMRRRDRRVEEFISHGPVEFEGLGSAAEWSKDLAGLPRSRNLRGKPPARSESIPRSESASPAAS
jgi:CHAD domain-containing protein